MSGKFNQSIRQRKDDIRMDVKDGKFWRGVQIAYNMKKAGNTQDEIRKYLSDHNYPMYESMIYYADQHYDEWLKKQSKPNGNGNGRKSNLQGMPSNLPRRMEHYVKNPDGVIVYVPRELLSRDERLIARIAELEKIVADQQLKIEKFDQLKKLLTS